MSNWYFHAAVATAFALSVIGCSQVPSRGFVAPAAEVAAPAERAIADRDTFPRRYDAVASAEVRPRVSGCADSGNVNVGDKNDVLLFVIDPGPVEEAVEKAIERLADAESQQILAGQELERAGLLIAINAIPPDQFERRAQAYREAEAEAQVAYGALQQAERVERVVVLNAAGN